jgi:hypothetical protein
VQICVNPDDDPFRNERDRLFSVVSHRAGLGEDVIKWNGSPALASAAALAAALVSASGPASSGEAAAKMGAVITPVTVVSAAELAATGAESRVLRSPGGIPSIEQLVHRLPDGSLTSAPSRTSIAALRVFSEPTTPTRRASLGPPSSARSGFSALDALQNVVATQFELEPPDQGLAVDSGVAVEIVNNVTRFFVAGTGAPLGPPIANAALFDSGDFNLSDPQVLFDPTTRRWFLTEIMYKGKAVKLAVAVSLTANPLGHYFVYQIPASSSDVRGCGREDCFPDYPKAGYDANALFITADLFKNVANGHFVESAIFVLSKLQLEAGGPLPVYRFDAPDDFVVQPSVPAPGEPFSGAENGSEFLMSAPSADRLSILAIVNTDNILDDGRSMRLRRITVGAQFHGAIAVPSTEPDVVGPYCRSLGVTSAPTLDGGYPALQATIQKAGGRLYGALAFGARDGAGLARDVVAWFAVRPRLSAGFLSANVVHQGYLVPENGYSLSYPAFGLDKTGAGTLGFSETNKSAAVPGGFPSASLIRFTGTGFSGPILVTGQGATVDDGFTGCHGPGPGGVGRWGDYGAATVDAATGLTYTANEMIPKSAAGYAANWGTFITQLR